MTRKSPVVEYIVEEVFRQGHDVSTMDGIERVLWMLEAWRHAVVISGGPPLARFPPRPPSFSDAIDLGEMIEPFQNTDGLRRCNVKVTGSLQVFPDWQDVPRLLRALFEERDALTPLAFYKEFELIHPFADGNGRTGKILLNWMNGTLYRPVFPPSDLFGEPILNP